MTDIGKRPRLDELIAILGALKVAGATIMDMDNPAEPDITVTIRFSRAALKQTAPDWVGENFKPIWLFEEIREQLYQWATQRTREEQWTSKEERFGASIEIVMAYWAEEIKKRARTASKYDLSETIAAQFIANTILRLQELLERRKAGGIYSSTETKREKARKAWMDDDVNGIKREEEQRRQHAEAQRRQQQWEKTHRQKTEDLYNQYKTVFEEAMRSEEFKSFFGAGGFGGRAGSSGGQGRTHSTQTHQTGKKKWFEVLEVNALATEDEIQKAYRKKAGQYHPDRYKGADAHEKMSELNVARDEGLLR